jgi:hypothetical protein
MANYEHVKKFCERVVNLQKTHSNEVRLTREEAVSIMCELNQMLINDSTSYSKPLKAKQKINSEISLDAGKFRN